jgi:hypothetical protein
MRYSNYLFFPYKELEILERFQWKALRMINNAPWFVPNALILRDHQTSTVKEEIRHFCSQYGAHLSTHPVNLLAQLTITGTTNPFVTRSAYSILSVIIVIIDFSIKIQIISSQPKRHNKPRTN